MKNPIAAVLLNLLVSSFISSYAEPSFPDINAILTNSDSSNFKAAYKKITEKVYALPLDKALRCNDELLRTAVTLPHFQQAFDSIYILCKFTFRRSTNDKEFLLYLLEVYDDPVFDKPTLQKAMLYDIGCFYYSINSFNQSANFMHQYLAVNSTPIHGQKTNALTTLGLIYQSKKDYDSSIFYFKSALLYAEKVADREWIGLCNGNLGMVYMEMGDFADAKPHFNLDIQISQQFHSYGSAAGSYAMLGKMATIQNNLPLAKIDLDSAMLLLSKIPTESYLHARADTYRALAEYYSKTKRSDSAYFYLARAFSMTDSLYNDKNQAIIRFKINDFNRKKHQQSLLLLKASEERNQQKARFVIITIIATLLITGILFVSIRQKHKINRMLRERSAAAQAKSLLIQQQKDKQEQLNKTKDKLFSLIAHDLRGPIGNLKTVLGLVETKVFSQEEFIRMLPEMKAKVDGVYDVADNLLRWAYAQIDGLTVKMETIQLEPIVQKVFALLESDARRKNISLTANLPHNAIIFADPNHIEIIIRNLVSNALKFSPADSLVQIDWSETNVETIISVKDTGIGIQKTLMEKLAKGEFSKPATGTNGEKGTGLGLVMCKEFVEANNGRIWASQNLPKGSVFSIALPIKH